MSKSAQRAIFARLEITVSVSMRIYLPNKGVEKSNYLEAIYDYG
jgi:hypothetical protein